MEHRRRKQLIGLCAAVAVLILCALCLLSWYCRETAPLRQAQSVTAEEVELIFTYRRPQGRYAEYTDPEEIASVLALLRGITPVGVGLGTPGGTGGEDSVVLMCRDGTLISLVLDLHHGGTGLICGEGLFRPAVLSGDLYDWLRSPDRETELRQADALPWRDAEN